MLCCVELSCVALCCVVLCCVVLCCAVLCCAVLYDNTLRRATLFLRSYTVGLTHKAQPHIPLYAII